MRCRDAAPGRGFGSAQDREPQDDPQADAGEEAETQAKPVPDCRPQALPHCGRAGACECGESAPHAEEEGEEEEGESEILGEAGAGEDQSVECRGLYRS